MSHPAFKAMLVRWHDG